MNKSALVTQKNNLYKEKFKELAHQIVELGRQANVTIRAYKDESLPYFSLLEDPKKEQIISCLSFLLKVCELTITNGDSLADSNRLTWQAIKELKWHPCSDLFSTITKESIIEIYDANNLQVFRSFSFFEFCSYSLEEIHSLPWLALYYRPNGEITQKIMTQIGRLFASGSKKTKFLGIPPHYVKESRSALQYEILVSVEYISPLFDASHRPAGVVAIETAKFFGPNLTTQSEEYAYLRHFQKPIQHIV